MLGLLSVRERVGMVLLRCCLGSNRSYLLHTHAQRTQYGFKKEEYTLKDIGSPDISQAVFLNFAMLGSCGGAQGLGVSDLLGLWDTWTYTG